MGKFKQSQSKGQKNVSQNNSKCEVKKQFDKAKWREQKYSYKAKINRFEERRKKTVLREYYKEIKRSGIPSSYDTQSSGPSSSSHRDYPNRKRSLKPHAMARLEAERIKQERENNRLVRQRLLEEKKHALLKYKNKKREQFLKLSKKTLRGQPVMAGRMELLLEKIQEGM